MDAGTTEANNTDVDEIDDIDIITNGNALDGEDLDEAMQTMELV